MFGTSQNFTERVAATSVFMSPWLGGGSRSSKQITWAPLTVFDLYKAPPGVWQDKWIEVCVPRLLLIITYLSFFSSCLQIRRGLCCLTVRLNIGSISFTEIGVISSWRWREEIVRLPRRCLWGVDFPALSLYRWWVTPCHRLTLGHSLFCRLRLSRCGPQDRFLVENVGLRRQYWPVEHICCTFLVWLLFWWVFLWHLGNDFVCWIKLFDLNRVYLLTFALILRAIEHLNCRIV